MANLMEPQERILKALATARGPMNRAGIADKAGVPENWVLEYVGAGTPESADRVRRNSELTDVLKLIPAGLARARTVDVDGHRERCFEITAEGRREVERLLADAT